HPEFSDVSSAHCIQTVNHLFTPEGKNPAPPLSYNGIVGGGRGDEPRRALCRRRSLPCSRRSSGAATAASGWRQLCFLCCSCRGRAPVRRLAPWPQRRSIQELQALESFSTVGWTSRSGARCRRLPVSFSASPRPARRPPNRPR